MCTEPTELTRHAGVFLQDLAAYSPGQHLKARLLAVNPTTKAAALSLQPHLLNFTITPDLPPVSVPFPGFLTCPSCSVMQAIVELAFRWCVFYLYGDCF